jgi:hypothetical protein
MADNKPTQTIINRTNALAVSNQNGNANWEELNTGVTA